ncbi:M48 family metallopeptidase [Parachryseolinea silvisoli]|uniref:M48 family metallopeptidase n=1 Tax=Parachryseolinea silvisoli TaxID=2873601 RepID=UPI002265F4D2|nr:M48 family metallopeptidase [Parachryseolinea silvisoli]MCD9014514.1 M48 family metallopeptidase [Parachryseolinea silvisoli]
MQPHTILVIILAITTISYVSGQLLDYLNLRAQRATLPDEIAAFYDRDKYVNSLAYHRALTRFSFLTEALAFLVSAGMLLTGGFGWIDAQLRPFFPNEIVLALVFFSVIALASDILTLPFQWYSTFVIEARYGFNKTTVRTFILDKLKGYLLGGLLGGLLLTALIYLVQILGPSFWLWFAVLATVCVLFINLFYTSLILPLYNKLTPLPEGSLKTAIETFARKVDFPLDNIFVIDGSKRSSKANAFFSGIGKKKKIVLYDTLLQQHTEEELVAVLAHEVGHFKKKHIVWSLVLAVVQIFFTLYVLSWMISSEALSLALGGSQQAIHLNLIAFATLFSPVSAVTGLLMSMYSRKNEFEADAYARATYDGPALMAALKKLSVENLSNLYPHPLYVFFHYSHPPLLQRLAALAK